MEHTMKIETATLNTTCVHEVSAHFKSYCINAEDPLRFTGTETSLNSELSGTTRQEQTDSRRIMSSGMLRRENPPQILQTDPRFAIAGVTRINGTEVHIQFQSRQVCVSEGKEAPFTQQCAPRQDTVTALTAAVWRGNSHD
jgi:hypothetical protein